jgi:hypothetical protein
MELEVAEKTKGNTLVVRVCVCPIKDILLSHFSLSASHPFQSLQIFVLYFLAHGPIAI